MNVLTAAQMREADRRTIEEIGIPSRVLMENAGRGVADGMDRQISDLRSRSIAVVCGKGNNGGDGLVVLRELAGRGCAVRAFILADPEQLRGDPRQNLDVARHVGLSIEAVPDEESWVKTLPRISSSTVIVDAIFGTGLSEPVRGLARRAIRDLNALSALRVAVDLPSGLSADTGALLGEAIHADWTFALAAPKVCHVLPPASLHCGRLHIVEIGIPASLVSAGGASLETIEPARLASLFPPRPPDAHKGHFGHLLIVAGSVGKTGAAVMAAQAALRAGAGLVTVAAPRSALSSMAPAVPEAMWEPLPETEDGAIGAGAVERIRSAWEGKTALALGPGLGRHPETVRFVQQVVAEIPVPAVLDADGLNALADDPNALPRDRAFALTPHPGEAARLLGLSASEVQRDRLAAARRLSAERRVFTVLKGHRTLVVDPSGFARVSLAGNPGMATGGTGDVLTGIIGSFLAQRIPLPEALPLAVHLHGFAGDLAEAEVGQTALVATDLIRKLPAALRALGAA